MDQCIAAGERGRDLERQAARMARPSPRQPDMAGLKARQMLRQPIDDLAGAHSIAFCG
jgi:hypothetical protein